jgi:hypothetical protein
MPAGLLFAIALLAEAAPAEAAPADPAPPKPPPTELQVKAPDRCPTLPATAQPGEIVVCGQKPEGYRLDPDVMAAKRAMRGGGRPKRPDRMVDKSCAVVGAAGCIGANPGINLIGAALTAAEMAARLAKGQEIGSMFVTDPQPTEYQLYLEAKRAREAKEAEAAAAKAAKVKAAKASPSVEVEGVQAKASPTQ